MKTKFRSFFWPGILVLCLLVVIAFAAFTPLVWPIAGSASASSSSVAALTPGQNAAIQGAGQILLLTQTDSWIFVPLVSR